MRLQFDNKNVRVLWDSTQFHVPDELRDLGRRRREYKDPPYIKFQSLTALHVTTIYYILCQISLSNSLI
jgi:hypothetical protein